MISKIEQAQLDVLDALIEEGGHWSGPWGRTLATLTERIYGEVGNPLHTDKNYQAVSQAVLRLESHGLVTVRRAYRDEHERANVIEAIDLA